MGNYPGGDALLRLQQRWGNIQGPGESSFFLPYPIQLVFSVAVHISNLAAQTGASLFLQLYSPPYHTSQYAYAPKIVTLVPWQYNKTENLSPSALSAAPFAFIISEIPESQDPVLEKHWTTLETVEGFDRWQVDWESLRGRGKSELLERIWDVLEFQTSPKLWLLKRKT
jgi:alpha-1,6-mannosyltransferase